MKVREDVKNGARDLNLDIVGEIHTVYKRTSKRGKLIRFFSIGPKVRKLRPAATLS